MEFVNSLSFSANGELICGAAALDRARLEALHAPDAELLPAQSLQELGEALVDARFICHPATRIVAPAQALVTNWERLQQGAGEMAVAGNKIAQGPVQGALVTRPQGRVLVRGTTPASTQFGHSLQAGATVMAAYEQAVALDEAFDLTQCFSEFLEVGAFSGVEPSG